MLRQSSTKYQNVYSVIKNNIASNKWPVGKIIPSEHELVDYFRVSRITIRSALNMLENDAREHLGLDSSTIIALPVFLTEV